MMSWPDVRERAGRALIVVIVAAAPWTMTPASATEAAVVISTYAGGPGEGPATSVPQQPVGVAVVNRPGGPLVYVADSANHLVRQVDTATGNETAVAGNGGGEGYSGDGGAATAAQLNIRDGGAVAVDNSGNLFIVDLNNHVVRRVDAGTKVITTVAGTGAAGFSGDGSSATTARLYAPRGVSVDSAGNLFIADAVNNRIRRVDGSTGIITTLAGTATDGFTGDGGPAGSARLSYPSGVGLDASGNLFIADTGNNRVRRIDAATQVITTVAGNGLSGFDGDDGLATNAELSYPAGVALDPSGSLYIADTGNHRIRRVDATSRIITTAAGSAAAGYGGDGGPAIAAPLADPVGIALDSSANLFIADSSNNRVRRVDATTQAITTVAGNGTPTFGGDGRPATASRLGSPAGIASDSSANLFIADSANHRVRRVDAATKLITTVAGTGTAGSGGDGGGATSAQLNIPHDVAVDSDGNLFIADKGNARVRKVDAATGIITTVVITDVDRFTTISLSEPVGLTVDSSDNLFVSDVQKRQVYKLESNSGVLIGTVGSPIPPVNGNGDGGPAADARLVPRGLAVDGSGNLFIADGANHRVRRVDATTQIITTVAGTGVAGFGGDGGPASSALLNGPLDVAVDASGGLFVADSANHRVRRVDANTQVVSTFAGNGAAGLAGDGGLPTSAAVGSPLAVAVQPALATTASPAVLITTANRIRQVADAPAPPIVARPVGDYDGDGDTDIAIYRPSTGTWYVRNQPAVTFGTQAGDVPVPGDYDGDGDADIAIYRPSTGTWYVRNQPAVTFGTQAGDIALPIPHAIRRAYFPPGS